MSDGGWAFTKREVEQYQFRGPHGAWAIITLDERGIFQAVSDFGSYSYEGWGHRGGESFKEFLCGLRDCDYFLGKVLPRGEEFDWDATVREIRRSILDRRRYGGLGKESARAAWDDVEHLEHNHDTTYFVMQMQRDCPALDKHLFDFDGSAASEHCVKRWPPIARRFFDEVFRGQLVPALRAELAAPPPDTKTKEPTP
jgi:hypothetical protein